jgi:hypothetical protein
VSKPQEKVAAPAPNWQTAAIVAGIIYLAIGRVFSWPTANAIAWRWAAWIVSGVVFLVHISFEHSRVRSDPRRLAAHAAVGVAIGGLLIAVAGFTTTLLSGSPLNWATWAIALVGFPAITAVPAFGVAFLAAKLLTRK